MEISYWGEKEAAFFKREDRLNNFEVNGENKSESLVYEFRSPYSKGVSMMITQFAPVLENESIYGLKPELDDQLCSREFICLELIQRLDSAAENVSSNYFINPL